MDKAATTAQLHDPPEQAGPELRAAPRFTLLIRAAKLVSAQGEFVCVIRDVSETGVSVRLFHGLPSCKQFELHMPAGGAYLINRVWNRDNEAGFAFADSVDVAKLIHESAEYPKRGLRLGLCFPVKISTLTQTCEAVVENLSQQGARFECPALLAIDQTVRIEAPDASGAMREVRAKVRWRREQNYGVVFDDTFALGEFARLAARLQAPALLEG
ncbi:PilZ domain-containing protein [Erythrobacter sp. NFXS35]|uniref:PilZ domain-containing protein n=1 Tax=Erythrobacter sp. NFXS35 TaxID=2818436 RepID=UPI0032DF666B